MHDGFCVDCDENRVFHANGSCAVCGSLSTIAMISPRGSYQIYSLEDLKTAAEHHGCELIVAKPNELLLDLDTAYDELKLLSLIREKFGPAEIVDAWESRNGGRHVRIRLDFALPTFMAIALQAALGSDPRRETLACWEYLSVGKDTRSLFRPKDAKTLSKEDL